MKLFFIILIIISSAALLLTSCLSSVNSESKEKKTLKLSHGHLLKCPNSPNCINSEYPEDKSHYLAPFIFPKADTKQIMMYAKVILTEMGASSITIENDYLTAIFTSSVFKFIDDFELRLDKEQQTLHIRSASRVGYSDFGVNKQRVTRFLQLISKQVNLNNT